MIGSLGIGPIENVFGEKSRMIILWLRRSWIVDRAAEVEVLFHKWRKESSPASTGKSESEPREQLALSLRAAVRRGRNTLMGQVHAAGGELIDINTAMYPERCTFGRADSKTFATHCRRRH